MNTNEKVLYWLDLADYDIETAKVNLEGSRFLYVGFMCHQAIEKALKAVFTKVTDGGVPPKIHNLPILAEKALLDGKISEEHLDLIRELNPLNVEARYPEYKERLLQTLSKDYCHKIIERTEGLLCWIKKQLQDTPTNTQTK